MIYLILPETFAKQFADKIERVILFIQDIMGFFGRGPLERFLGKFAGIFNSIMIGLCHYSKVIQMSDPVAIFCDIFTYSYIYSRPLPNIKLLKELIESYY